jgi:multiple sugar transport system ATP-binding protein
MQLPEEMRRKVEDHASKSSGVVIGIRPEDFEDAELVGDKRERGQVVEAEIDVLESLGSDKFAYFTVQGERAVAKQLEEVARDAGAEDRLTSDGIQVTARLDAASKAQEDSKLDIWLDVSKVHVFDPDSGKNLTL